MAQWLSYPTFTGPFSGQEQLLAASSTSPGAGMIRIPWTAVSGLIAGTGFLPLTGGSLSGPLTLPGNATLPLQAVPLQQVQAITGGPFLQIAGGTLTGPLTLAADPTAALGAATKEYVDGAVAAGSFLPLSGGTVSGPIVLPGNATLPLQAVPLQQVTAIIGGPYLPLSGGTLTGALVLAADPTLSLGAATKQYVDSAVVSGPFLPLAGGMVTGATTFSADVTFSGASTGLAVSNNATVGGTFVATGGINGTPVGAVTPSTGSFTNLTASGTVTLPSTTTGPFLLLTGGTVSGPTTVAADVSVTGGGPGATIVTGSPYGISYYANASLSGWGVADLAFAAVSRASDGNILNAAVIGVAAAGISDKTTGNANSGSWAFYGTAQRFLGSLDYSTLVFEGNVASKDTLVATNPYFAAPHGVTSCLWVGVGGELAQLHGPVNPVSAAITLVTTDPAANSLAGTGGVFNRGIVFARNAISGTDGTTGDGVAISLAKGHRIQWDYDDMFATGGAIRSEATAASSTLTFVNSAFNIQDTSSHTIYAFGTPFNPDTGFFWTPASGAAQAVFGIVSSQTNASLELAVQGNGNFSFNTGNGAQFQVLDNGATPTVNRAYAIGAVTGVAPLVGARGNDTNINFRVLSKGAGYVTIESGNGEQFRVVDSAGSAPANNAYVEGATTGNPPILGVIGSDTNVGLSVLAKAAAIITLGNGNGTQVRTLAGSASTVRSVDIVGAVSGGSPQVTASAGNLFLGNSGLATNATTGFIQIPTCAGAPSGTPSNAGAGATLIYDATDNKLYIYNGSWRSSTFT